MTETPFFQRQGVAKRPAFGGGRWAPRDPAFWTLWQILEALPAMNTMQQADLEKVLRFALDLHLKFVPYSHENLKKTHAKFDKIDYVWKYFDKDGRETINKGLQCLDVTSV